MFSPKNVTDVNKTEIDLPHYFSLGTARWSDTGLSNYISYCRWISQTVWRSRLEKQRGLSAVNQKQRDHKALSYHKANIKLHSGRPILRRWRPARLNGFHSAPTATARRHFCIRFISPPISARDITVASRFRCYVTHIYTDSLCKWAQLSRRRLWRWKPPFRTASGNFRRRQKGDVNANTMSESEIRLRQECCW